MTKQELLENQAFRDAPMDAVIVLVDEYGNAVIADYVDVSLKFNQIEVEEGYTMCHKCPMSGIGCKFIDCHQYNLATMILKNWRNHNAKKNKV